MELGWGILALGVLFGEAMAQWQPSLTEYHADRTCQSSTTLRLYRSDPLAFYRNYLGESRPDDQTAFAMGRAFHAALEGTYFDDFVVEPKFDMRTTAGKDGAKAFAEASFGKTPVSQAVHDFVVAGLKAVSEHQEAWKLINMPGQNELSTKWQDKSGLALKVRFDRLLDDGTILEYKTSEASGAAALSQFSKHAKFFGYDLQAAMYSRGRDMLGMKGGHIFIVVTKTAVPQVMVLRSSASFLSRGRLALDDATRRLAQAIAREELDPGKHNWVQPHFKEIQELL